MSRGQVLVFFKRESKDTVPQREAGRTNPYGSQEVAFQAHQAFNRHYSCFAISCRFSGPLSSELSQNGLQFFTLKFVHLFF